MLILVFILNSLFSFDVNVDFINDFRTSFHQGKQRIVIDIDSNKKPSFYIKDNIITIEARINSNKIEEIKKNFRNKHFVQQLDIVSLNNEGEVIIVIKTKAKIEKVFALPSPSRVVIDIIG
jgi:hypothetical protein